MEKYGMIVGVTEEFLRLFFSPTVMDRLDILGEVVKEVILYNWCISHMKDEIKCDTLYDIKTDMYLFRLKANKPVRGFVQIFEGREYPRKKWLLEE